LRVFLAAAAADLWRRRVLGQQGFYGGGGGFLGSGGGFLGGDGRVLRQRVLSTAAEDHVDVELGDDFYVGDVELNEDFTRSLM
jgi:hypothetical protein